MVLLLGFCVYHYGRPEAGTFYAPGFSEAEFRNIEIGTTETEVLRVLGAPLRIVGNRFYYFYDDGRIVFLVDEKQGHAELSSISKGEHDGLSPYTRLQSIEQVKSIHGTPERVIAVDLGQSENRNVVSYIYSRQKVGAPWWEYRKIDIDKDSRTVVGSVSRTLD